jgi:hypothetical protein
VREDNFFAVVLGGVLRKMWAQNVVFGWYERGGLRGKRGELTLTVVVAKDAPCFSTLF